MFKSYSLQLQITTLKKYNYSVQIFHPKLYFIPKLNARRKCILKLLIPSRKLNHFLENTPPENALPYFVTGSFRKLVSAARGDFEDSQNRRKAKCR